MSELSDFDSLPINTMLGPRSMAGDSSGEL